MESQFFLPIIIAVGLFVLVQFLTRKNVLNNNQFVRLRILLSCIYVGYLVSEITRATSLRSVITLVLLTGIIIAGVYNLQKKYFVLKGTE